MMYSAFRKKVASFTFAVFLAVQILTITSGLMIPKPAEACVLIATCTIEIGNLYDIGKDVGIAALRQIAIQFANKFLTRFVNKLQDKYKIRNFLYYDQVLTNYLLSGYIRDKIGDPDLRQIYSLLEAGFVTGAYTGTTGAPNPNNALLVQLKTAINKKYLEGGGIDPALLDNPPADWSAADKFDAARLSYVYNPVFYQQDIYNQYNRIQDASSTAAQLEVIVGRGLKAGRVVGGTCSVTTPVASVNPSSSPSACASVGGTWQVAALDKVRSFIENPTMTVSSLIDNAIGKITDNQFDPNNYKAVIGSYIGSYLFNQLGNLGKDTLSEAPGTYVPDTDPTGLDPQLNGSDIDGDGIIDQYDSDNNGTADVCVYGGVDGGSGPPCRGSVDAGNPAPSTSGGGFIACDDPPSTISPDPTGVASSVRSQMLASDPTLDFTDDAVRSQFTQQVATTLNATDSNWGRKKSSATAPLSTDTLGYLRPDQGPGRFEAVDLLNGATGELQRGCYGLVPADQVWVAP